MQGGVFKKRRWVQIHTTGTALKREQIVMAHAGGGRMLVVSEEWRMRDKRITEHMDKWNGGDEIDSREGLAEGIAPQR